LIGLTHGANLHGPLFPGKSCYPMSPLRRQVHNKDESLHYKEITILDEFDQLNMIINILGSPSEKDMEFIKDENTKNYVWNFGDIKPVSFKDVFPEATEEAIDLLLNMIRFNPKERFDIEQCLSHSLFSTCQNFMRPCEAFIYLDYEKENFYLSTNDLKALLLREVNYFNPVDNFQQMFGYLISELTEGWIRVIGLT